MRTCDTLGDVICILKSLSGTPRYWRLAGAQEVGIDSAGWKNGLERRKRDQLDHLSELSQVGGCVLDFLQTIANGVGLLDDLIQAVANRGLLEKIIDSRHLVDVGGEDCRERIFTKWIGWLDI